MSSAVLGESTMFVGAMAADAVAAIWMEVTLFAAAGLVYSLFAGSKIPQPPPNRNQVRYVKASANEVGKDSGERQCSRTENSRGACTVHHTRAEMQRGAATIRAFAHQNDLKAATSVFNDLRSKCKDSSALIYNCFLDALVHCGEYEASVHHFEDMKRLGLVDIVGYNTMLKSYLCRGKLTDACALVSEMSARGLKANQVTYNELLHAKVRAKDFEGMWSILDEMHTAGLKVNSVTCSILLKSVSAQSDSEGLRRVVGLIDECNGPIDEVLLASVVEACVRLRQLPFLSDLMRRYRSKGCCARLAAPTYGCMIKAYGLIGDIDRVRELWNEMEELLVKPTEVTFGCMTEALVQNGGAEEAWQLLKNALDSEERKAFVNTVTYSTVLKGFAMCKRLDRVFSVYEEMKLNSIKCNTITYNTMLDACARCSAMTRSHALLEDMKLTGTAPDLITLSTIIKGYCLEGDVDRALSLFEAMRKEHNLEPDEIVYNSMLDGCAKQHRVEDAMRLLDQMKADRVCPSNYTLSILVKLLGRAKRLPQAFRVVDELSQRHGFRPNVQVYTCLVQACIMNRRLDRALDLRVQIAADKECRVDEKFHGVLARGCLQMGQPLKASEVVRDAYQLPRRGRPVGVDAAALAEVAARLRTGSQEEQEALAVLQRELGELGVQIDESGAKAAPPRRGGGGGGSKQRSLGKHSGR